MECDRLSEANLGVQYGVKPADLKREPNVRIMLAF